MLALFCCLAVLPQSDAFRDQVGAAGRRFDAQLEANAALLLSGRDDDATAALLALAPAAERTAAQCFVLGNVLFKVDHAASFELHERAYELAPDEAPVVFEWAIQLHRRRRFAEAKEAYASYLRHEDSAQAHALLGECLMQLGSAREALAEFAAAAPGDNAHEIESALFWIHGPEHPIRERCRLLRAIAAGDLGQLETLIGLDLHWRTDWWNDGPQRGYLEHDLALARQLLGDGAAGADAQRLAELALFAELPEAPAGGADPFAAIFGKEDQGDRAAEDDALRSRLTAAGLLGADAHLPRSSIVAAGLVDRMLEAALTSPAELLAAHGDELARRAHADTPDLAALELLAALYEATDDARLPALDAFGFERCHQARFAASLLSGLGDDLESDDPRLRAALAAFPRDAAVTRIALERAHAEDRPIRELLVQQILAECAHLASWSQVAPWIALLRRELDADK